MGGENLKIVVALGGGLMLLCYVMCKAVYTNSNEIRLEGSSGKRDDLQHGFCKEDPAEFIQYGCSGGA